MFWRSKLFSNKVSIFSSYRLDFSLLSRVQFFKFSFLPKFVHLTTNKKTNLMATLRKKNSFQFLSKENAQIIHKK